MADEYGDGAAYLVFALFCVSQPRGLGQDLERAQEHLERAIELAGPGNLLPQVLYAEHYGKATLDAGFFARQLNQVLAVDVARYPDRRFTNELAQQRARSLLSRQDEIF